MTDPSLFAQLALLSGDAVLSKPGEIAREMRGAQRFVAYLRGEISQPLYVALENADDEKCRDEAEERSRDRLN